MRGSSFGYLIREGFRNLRQNRAISTAAIGVLVACLLLVGFSLLFSMNVTSLVGYFESQNEIVVFLDDNVEGSRLTRLDEQLKSIDNISSISFISREEGLEQWMEELGDDGTLLEWLVEDNPLQNSYRLVITDLSRMDETVAEIEAISGVESVSASPEVAHAVTGLKQAVSLGSLGVIGILAVVSLCIVSNTIRITIFNRRKEISIMKYVGATDTFIRLPFLSEGILLGFLAATIAFFLLWGGYEALLYWLNNSALTWASMITDQLVPFKRVALQIYLVFLGTGVAISGIGSLFFVGKYLKV